MKFSGHLTEAVNREPGQRPPRRHLEPDGPGDPPGALRAAASAVLGNRVVVYAPRWRLETSAKRKTVGLKVTGDAVLTVSCPAGLTAGQLDLTLRAHARWVTRAVTAAEAGLPDRPVKELAAGEGFCWLGWPHRLDVTREPDGPARFDRDGFGRWLRLPGGLPGEAGREAIVSLYVTEGTAWARQETQRRGWLPRLSLAGNPPLITAACLDDGRWYEYRGRSHQVRLHWAVFQLDTGLVRYLLVHALVHATRPPGAVHGPEFRRRLGRVVLDWRDLDTRLAAAARTMWTGNVKEDASHQGRD